MRKIVLFCLISLVITTVNAQYRIIDKTKSWNVLKSSKDQRTVSYKFFSDTTINNKLYSSLYFSFSDRIDSSEMNFAGFIREDTAKGNVYIRFLNGEEFVIYNFKAKVCDIVNLPAYNQASKLYFEVDFIDSTIIDGQKKNRLFLTSLDRTVSKDQVWIEGVGSNLGLIESSEAQFGRYWSRMLCVKEDAKLLWSNKKGICYIVSGNNTNKIAFKRNKRKKTKAKIFSFDFELKHLLIKVINSKGKVVKLQEMKTRKDQTVYHIKKGDYLLEIVDVYNKVYFTKKIKIN